MLSYFLMEMFTRQPTTSQEMRNLSNFFNSEISKEILGEKYDCSVINFIFTNLKFLCLEHLLMC